jgi:hypothetical protein
MHMVRHEYVTANADVEVALGTLGKKDECRMDFVTSQKRSSLVGAKGDEVEKTPCQNAT